MKALVSSLYGEFSEVSIEARLYIPDAYFDEYDLADLESKIPNKAKSVSKADGFNAPPLKGRKYKYSL